VLLSYALNAGFTFFTVDLLATDKRSHARIGAQSVDALDKAYHKDYDEACRTRILP
jgi:hypothetical protein